MNIVCYIQKCKFVVLTPFLLTPDFYCTLFPIEIIIREHYYYCFCYYYILLGVSRVVQSVKRLITGWTVLERIPVGRDIPPVQTGLGAHPSSRTMGTRSFPG